ncbi:MAG TPA: secondary thiamine-phosphate synthase enzyme YjbQ [Acidobacteriota bacterium]|nr:secondary thiamine-phosphate synthase enzyme YjbQ [Acidobacteriota bacterium]
MIKRIQINSTRRCEMIDITPQVAEAVREAGIDEGLCTVYCPHTTGAVTVNEGADPDVAADILARLERLAPPDAGYRHAEGNSDAHVKAALIGPSVSIPIENGRPALGTWQRIFFCEFDGPRQRTALIKIS